MAIAITDALRGEHGVLYRLLDHLERETPAATLERAREQGACLAAALEAHAQLEDELLFGALAGVLDETSGPLVVMRQEHEAIERDLVALRTAGDVAAARQLAARLVGTARDHFAKEEQILFPLAERLLGAGQLVALGERWAERSSVAISGCSCC